jgi:hypothetical protein
MPYGVDRTLYTVAVFQDLEWAGRGLEALAKHGFTPETLSIVVKSSPDAVSLVEQTLGGGGSALEIRNLGETLAQGSLVSTLQGSDGELGRAGIAAAMRRAGFQAHDGFIFETLIARGGVLVGIESEPRAADALAVMHAYGGGNAAIGAWHGRV